MKIEKLACCLAHPVTALRAIKEKVNEIIDNLENVSTGGGGGSSGGGSGAVIVHATASEDMQTAEVDMTPAEMLQLIGNGVPLFCYLSMGGTLIILPVVTATSYDTNIDINFSAYVMGMTVQLIAQRSDSGENLYNVYMGNEE